MPKDYLPLALTSGVHTTAVGNELVVFNTTTSTASCLNKFTAVVWGACDGRNDIESLLAIVRNAGYQDATTALILMAIDQLSETGLLEDSVEINEVNKKHLKRREMLSLLGKSAAAVLPVVTTINIQPAIAQSSPPPTPCRRFHQSCTAIGQCCPGCECNVRAGKCQGFC